MVSLNTSLSSIRCQHQWQTVVRKARSPSQSKKPLRCWMTWWISVCRTDVSEINSFYICNSIHSLSNLRDFFRGHLSLLNVPKTYVSSGSSSQDVLAVIADLHNFDLFVCGHHFTCIFCVDHVDHLHNVVCLQDDQPASVPCIIWQHPHLKRYRRQLNPFDTLMQLEIPYKQMRRFGYIRYVQCQVSVRE